MSSTWTAIEFWSIVLKQQSSSFRADPRTFRAETTPCCSLRAFNRLVWVLFWETTFRCHCKCFSWSIDTGRELAILSFHKDHTTNDCHRSAIVKNSMWLACSFEFNVIVLDGSKFISSNETRYGAETVVPKECYPVVINLVLPTRPFNDPMHVFPIMGQFFVGHERMKRVNDIRAKASVLF